MNFVSRAASGATTLSNLRSALPALFMSLAVAPAAMAQAPAAIKAATPQPVAAAAVKEIDSLCAAQEAIVFNCRVGDKLVSICATKNEGAAAADSSLQYRVGFPRADESPELKLPAADDKMPTTITGENGTIPGGNGSWLRFRRAPMSFTVYTATGKWGAKGEITEKQGVVVERRGTNISTAQCTGKVQSQLSADWFTKNNVSAKNEKFTFPE